VNFEGQRSKSKFIYIAQHGARDTHRVPLKISNYIN